MGRYVVRRLLWTILVVLIVTLLTFVIFYVMPPGNPAVRFAGKQPTPELIAEVEHNLGLDKSLPEQYGLFLKRLFTGDGDSCPAGISGCGWPGLGVSYDSRTAVREEMIERTPRTLALIVGAATIWLIMGVSIGVLSALKRRTIWDRLAMGFALFGISAPVFWLGLLALYVFSNTLDIEALGTGYVDFKDNPVDWFTHLLLPWFVLALLYAAFYARMTRGNLIDVMGEDYIRTARAKGLKERRVIVRHGLRAAITPVITVLGLDLGILVGSAILTESVFGIPGVGRLSFDAIQRGDLATIQGTTVFFALAVVIMNLVVDILYAYLDPRVRY
jgi:peptide/nickel transport system permease protein